MNRTLPDDPQDPAARVGGGASGGRALGALLGLLLLLGAGGAFLLRYAGMPRPPRSLPDWEGVWFTLRGADVPLEAALYVSGAVSWGLWSWLTASVVLRLVVLGADVCARGTVWAGALRALSDRVTLPIVRRVVDGAVVAGVVVQLAGRAPAVSAAPLTGAEASIAVAYEAAPESGVGRGGGPAPPPHRPPPHPPDRGDQKLGICPQLYRPGGASYRCGEGDPEREYADGALYKPRVGTQNP